MTRSRWTFTLRITIAARQKEKAQDRLARILNRKEIAKHKVISLVNDFTGGSHFCPEVLVNNHRTGK